MIIIPNSPITIIPIKQIEAPGYKKPSVFILVHAKFLFQTFAETIALIIWVLMIYNRKVLYI